MVAAAASVWHAEGFRHLGMPYSDDDGFLASTCRFVEDGLSDDEAVMVMLPREKQRQVKSALAARARRVHFADMQIEGRNPSLIISVWRDFVEHHTRRGRRVRGVGEPAWPGRRDEEYAEVALHEALCTRAFAGGSSWALLCPYDTSRLPPDVQAAARAAHPEFWRRAASTCNPDYAGDGHADALMSSELPRPRTAQIRLPAGDLVAMREVVVRVAVDAGLATPVVEQLALAAHEVAHNALRHGELRPDACAWIDVDRGAVMVEIGDRGQLANPLAGRLRPGLTGGGGRGLWMANHLCDLVQIRNTSRGTVIRLICWLPD
ncbi:MAG: anti-sigma factor RsbA family regulatory protein [Nocardioidaceae bacterium]